MDDDDHEPSPTLYEFMESLGRGITSVFDHAGDLMVRAWFYPGRAWRAWHYTGRHCRVA